MYKNTELLLSVLNGSDAPKFGEYIISELKVFGISLAHFARVLGIKRPKLNKILSGEEDVTLTLFIQMAEFLNEDVKDLMNIYVASAPAKNITAIQHARRAGIIEEYLDINGLKKWGFIQSKDPSGIGYIANRYDYEAIEKRILIFFGISSLSEYARQADEIQIPQRKTTQK